MKTDTSGNAYASINAQDAECGQTKTNAQGAENKRTKICACEEMYCMFLSSIEGLGCVQADILMEYFGSAEAIFNASAGAVEALQGVRPEVKDNLLTARKTYDIQAEAERLQELGIGYISRWNPAFPKRLAGICNPPNGIFYKGSLPQDNVPAVAIIGSRGCSAYGREMALRFGRGLADAGVDVISGMAAGIDGYAHRGALNGGGDTYAVLGCGVDICYPRENRDIYLRIAEQGGILSEYYPGSHPLSVNFPRRNRIISALSDAILVVEAREKSGTLITVDMGLEQGRDIYAIPGRIGDAVSVGCNRLIRNGARLVTDPEDVLAELAPMYGYLVDRCGHGDPAAKTSRHPGGLTANEEKLYRVLDYSPKSPSELARAVKMDMSAVLASLTMLELKGCCEMAGSGKYVLKGQK